MAAWRAAKSLLTLHTQLKAGSHAGPPATQPEEWGLKADSRHDETSDHTPHDFPKWGKQIVTAADFPNRPDLGLDAFRVLDDIRRSQDPRAKYGISMGKIFSNHAVTEHGHSYEAWQWRPYLDSHGRPQLDQHITHGHLSVVGSRLADGTQPWATIGGPTAGEDDDEMGASFGPIDIEPSGYTSLTIPPVQKGDADPRQCWLNLCNDTDGQPYWLRVMVTEGNKSYYPLPGWADEGGPGVEDAIRRIEGGERVSVELPPGVSGLSVLRVPGHEAAPFPGHLTLAIERGPLVVKK